MGGVGGGSQSKQKYQKTKKLNIFLKKYERCGSRGGATLLQPYKAGQESGRIMPKDDGAALEGESKKKTGFK